MEQNDYLILSKDGKTVIGCRWDYEGSVVIPDGVTKIADCAFSDCSALTSIKIPNSVTRIGWDSFSRCTSLASIEIPNSVTEIGTDVFLDCTNLIELNLRHKRPINQTAFFYNLYPSKITLYVPIGTGYAYRHHPFYSKFKKVVIER